MASTQANTWPPLVSGGSQDELLQTQLYGKEVIASALFEAATDDEFFFPVDGVLTGYAYDGRLYQNGAEVPATDLASWALETPGLYRGTRASFPQRGLVLLTDAGLTILDLEDRYALWMVALRGDTLGLTHNFLDNISGFTPSGVAYQNGRVVVTMSPDPGSAYTSSVFVVFDFVTDEVYMDRPAYRAPVVGPYNPDPATYFVGVPISPNIPVVDLVNGGKPTFWWSYPGLPTGLVLDTETGAITGTPQVESGPDAFQVVAYNPGGFGETVWTLTVAVYVPSTTADILAYSRGIPPSLNGQVFTGLVPGAYYVAFETSTVSRVFLNIDRGSGVILGDLWPALEAQIGGNITAMPWAETCWNSVYFAVELDNDGNHRIYRFDSSNADPVSTLAFVTDTATAEAACLIEGAEAGVISYWTQEWGEDTTFFALFRNGTTGNSYVYVHDLSPLDFWVETVPDPATDSLGGGLDPFEAFNSFRGNPWGDRWKEVRTLGCRWSQNWDPDGLGYDAIVPEISVLCMKDWASAPSWVTSPAVYPVHDPTDWDADSNRHLNYVAGYTYAGVVGVWHMFAREQPQDGPSVYYAVLVRDGQAFYSWETADYQTYAYMRVTAYPFAYPWESQGTGTNIYVVGIPLGFLSQETQTAGEKVRTVVKVVEDLQAHNTNHTLLSQHDAGTGVLLATDTPLKTVLSGAVEEPWQEETLESLAIDYDTETVAIAVQVYEPPA